MLVRRFSVVGCLMAALGLLLGSASSAVAGPGPHRYGAPNVYPGQNFYPGANPYAARPLPCVGEANLIVAINAMNQALRIPQHQEVALNAAEYQIKMALRIQECNHVQRDLNGALQMLNAYRYRRDPAALQAALARTECALNELREHCLAEQQALRPVLPPPVVYPPVAYPPVYPVPYQNRSLTISKGSFSITIPLNR